MLSQNRTTKPLQRLLLFSLLFILLSSALTQIQADQSKAFVLHPSWYKIKHKAENDPMFYGKPMSIKKIQHTGKRWKCGDKYCYSYRIVLNRPSRDKGDGVIWYGTSPFKIEYWVGEAYSLESDVLAAVTGGYDISQLQEKRREIILSFNQAFLPGKYYLKIAPFPYPSLQGSTLAKYIGYYRHDLYSVYEAADDYFGLAKDLKNVMSGLIFGKIQDVALDTLLIKVANKYGIYLVLEIPAVMPDILGKDVKLAHNELLTSSLRPEPKNWKCTKTRDSSLYGKVFKTQYRAGKLLNLNQRVVYDYYCLPKPVPNIKGMHTKDADHTLRKYGFRPAPGKCVPTQNRKLHNKVFRYALKADLNERVAYKYYCFQELKVQSSSNFQQCPKTNPGSRLKNKFDTNNNRKDGNYIICNYFKDGALQYQAPHVNGKKHYLVLSYQNERPHKLSQSANYKNGQRDGLMKVWVGSGSKYYLLRKVIYKAGKQSSSIQWHSNGNKRTVTTYKSNGRAHLQHNFNKHGKPTYCTEWDDRGYPMDCKTKRYR